MASGIRISRWMKEPQKFLKKHKDELNKQEKILGLFVSCGTALTDPEKANNEYLVKKIEKLGIKPNIYQAFGPILDFSETSKMG